MKKIINGKKYNTETAKKMGCWSNDYSHRSFNFCEESLYRKKTGEYFLYGIGGPMSRYSQPCGQNTWSGGSKIIPMTAAEAMEWVEEHLTADEYEEIFGEVEE